jgi:hypothetical protein
MENTRKKVTKGSDSAAQAWIIKFRSSDALYVKLETVAEEEEMCLAAQVQMMVLDRLERLPD